MWNSFSERKIQSLLGESHPGKIKGSTTYFVKSFRLSADATPADFLENAKLSFQAFSGGLLLRIQKNNQQHLWPLRYSEIESLKLSMGAERLNPNPLNPMYWLLKLGVAIEHARYFNIFHSEYRIQPVELHLEAEGLALVLHCNGYLFKGQKRFFEQLEPQLNLSLGYN